MRYGMMAGAVMLVASSLFGATTAKWTNATGNGLWNDAGNWVDNSSGVVLSKAPDLDYECRIEAYNENVMIDLGNEGAHPYKLYLPSGNKYRVILTGTGAYTHSSTASSFVSNNGKSLVEFRCPVIVDRASPITYGVVFKNDVTVNVGSFSIDGPDPAVLPYEGNEDYLRCEIHGKFSMPRGTFYAAYQHGNCKTFVEEGADVSIYGITLGTNGWFQVNGGRLAIGYRIESANADPGSFGPRFVQKGGETICTSDNKPVSLYSGIFELQDGVFSTPGSGVSNDGVHIRRAGEGNGFLMSGGELHTSKVMFEHPDSKFFQFTGGTACFATVPTYSYPWEFTGAKGSVIDVTSVDAALRPHHYANETVNVDSTVYVTNGVKSSFCIHYPGAYGLTGSGAIYVNRINYNCNGGQGAIYLNVSGVSLNLGPGTNYCEKSGSTIGSSLNLSGGASLGKFGNDDNAWNGNQLELGIEGEAEIRTTDALDGVTPRVVGGFRTRIAEGAELKVSGNGTFEPNLSGSASFKRLELADSARLRVMSGQTLAPGTIVLSEASKIEVNVPAETEKTSIAILSGDNLPGDILDHLEISGEGAAGRELVLLDGTVVLYKSVPAEGIEWIGQGGDDKWMTSANWNNGMLPADGDAVAFGGMKNREVDNDSEVSPSNIWFRASAGPFVIGGNQITITAPESSSGAQIAGEAAIRNSSAFAQTFDTPVKLSGYYANIWCDDVQPIIFKQGFTKKDSTVFIRGTVKVGGTSSANRTVRFYKSGTATPSCLHVIEGGDFTIIDQQSTALSESSVSGCIAVDGGARMTIAKGRMEFRDAQTIVVNGELRSEGHFMTDISDTIFSGTGTVYIAATHSSNHSSSRQYNRFVGTDGLTLELGGNWTTVDDFTDGKSQKNSVGLKLTDGTKLLLKADCVYGPKAGIGETYSTPADRKAIFTDTVTVDTDGHALAFADPVDASAATLVKVGKGRMNLGSDYAVRDLTVSNGCVCAASPLLAVSGTLTLAEDGEVRPADAELSNWTAVATADEIVLPAAKWQVGKVMYRVVPGDGCKMLQARKASGMTIFFR